MVVINRLQNIISLNCSAFALLLRAPLLLISLLFPLSSFATVLPDERVDVLEHSYDGGGIKVSGPSVLVRKNIGSSVSVSANYYVDMVSSASIDVLASASRYSEKRTEKSAGLDYIHDRTTMSFGYTTSDENDYHAKTYSLGIAQSFFGDLTTLGLGLTFGQDVVGRNINGDPDPSFHLDKERHKYSISLSQILTKNLIADLSIDSGSDQCINMQEGESCLNNPYRQVRYISATGLGFQSEKYPLTHNTDAMGLRAIYHLPFRASIRGDLRKFSDSWGVESKNAELRYTQEVYKDVLLEVKYRIYDQTAADFYKDLFPYKDAQTFLARDKELSPFSDKSIGLGVTYKMPWGLPGIEKSTVNFYWDHMQFDYDDFRDYKGFTHKMPDGGYIAGEEPLYSFDADIIRFYLSFWF